MDALQFLNRYLSEAFSLFPVLLHYTLSTLLYSSTPHNTPERYALHSHPPVTEEKAPLGQDQGLTRVARQDAASGNADLAEAPRSDPSSLACAQLRSGGRARREQVTPPPALPSSARHLRPLSRGAGPCRPQPSAGSRSSASPVPPPRHTPPTTAQAFLVPSPAPRAGSSRVARRETTERMRRSKPSNYTPRKPFAH